MERGYKTEKVKQLLLKGNMGVREIARQVGCAPSLVMKLKRKLGFRIKSCRQKKKAGNVFLPYNPPDFSEILIDLDDGKVPEPARPEY